ncbi:MAG: hypothetical protein AB7S48_09045 [Bacteroidales bacterium]
MEQNRKNYQDKAHKTLDDIFASLHTLEDKAKTVSKEFSDTMEENIQQLKVEGEKLKGKFDELCNANNDSWDDIRNGFEKAANSLRDSFSNAWNRFQNR